MGILAGDCASNWAQHAVESQKPISEAAGLYTPLERERRHIRLLRVTRLAQSDAKETRFAAQLVHVTLDDNPTYLAFEYNSLI